MYKAEKVIDGKTVVLKVMREEDWVESPREWDNIGKMICWHSRYDLGDSHDFRDVDDFVRSLAEDVVRYEYLIQKSEEYFKDFRIENLGDDGWAIVDSENIYDVWFDDEEEALDRLVEMKEEYRETYIEEADIDDLWELLEEEYVILPLYLYDHSGITMNTTGFSCHWDSGQVGYIYASKEDLLKETSYSEKQLFEDGKAEEILKNEVKVYDQYLRGDVYTFELSEKEVCECCGSENEKVIESAGEFFGDIYYDNSIEDMKTCVEKKYHVLFDELESDW